MDDILPALRALSGKMGRVRGRSIWYEHEDCSRSRRCSLLVHCLSAVRWDIFEAGVYGISMGVYSLSMEITQDRGDTACTFKLSLR